MSTSKPLLRAAAILTLWAMPLAAFAQAQMNDEPKPGIQLLEPIGSTQFIPTDDNQPLGALGYYIALLYPWLVGMGAAVAVLMGLVGGVQIMLAGADSSKRSAGMTRLLTSLGGLIFVLLSSTILKALNPSFFK